MPLSGCRQSGLSLVELMLSAALSCLLISVLIHMFLSSKNQYAFTQKRLTREFELMQVSELLRDSSRRAGFTPCRNIRRLISKDRRNPDHRLSGIETRVGPYHALQIAYVSDEFFPVQSWLSSTRLRVAGRAAFAPGQALVLADCFYAEVLTVASSRVQGKDTLITLDRAWRFPYSQPTYVGAWVEERFYAKPGSPGLFYDARQPEQLTNHIVGLVADQSQDQLLRVHLKADDGKTLMLETRPRTP